MEINTTLRNNMAAEIATAIGATGRARFQNAAQTATYASCALNNPAFTSTGGVATLDVTPAVQDTSASASGADNVTRLAFYTSATAAAGTWIMRMGVNDTGTPDVTISNNTFQTGDQVQITSLTVTVPAGTVDAT